MYHVLSAKAKGQIDNLVKMLHDMENKKLKTAPKDGFILMQLHLTR